MKTIMTRWKNVGGGFSYHLEFKVGKGHKWKQLTGQRIDALKAQGYRFDFEKPLLKRLKEKLTALWVWLKRRYIEWKLR